MKKIIVLSFLFVCVPIVLCSDDAPECYEACVQRLEKKCSNVIDDIFAQAQESIKIKENIITPEWLAHKEIEELRHLLSDACIELVFDRNGETVIPARLETYIETKIRDEATHVFTLKKVDPKRVDQFFDLAKIVCAFSQGSDCRSMIRSIKDENFIPLQKIKFEKKIRDKAKRDKARALRERIILGAHPRK